MSGRSNSMERFRRFAESVKNPVVAGLAPYWEAFFLFDGGSYGQALRSLSQGQELLLAYFRGGAALPRVEALMAYEREIMEGFAAVREGRLEEARRRADAATAVWPKSERARLMRDAPLKEAGIRLRAEVLLLEGKPVEAIALMDKEFRPTILGYGAHAFLGYLFQNFPLDQDVVPRAYEKMGETDKAIETYQKLLTFDPRGQDRRMHIPVYHYRLAKLYDSKGLKEQARGEYQNLLEDWKDADADIPELIDAKKRI